MIKRPWHKDKKVSVATRTKNDNRKIYDSSKWRYQLRPMKLRNTPFCEVCMDEDRLTEAKEVDHVKPISEGGEPFEIGNLQSLCVSCHAKKSALEGQIRR